jgi:tetratricopeptide (TPR) repeat protein
MTALPPDRTLARAHDALRAGRLAEAEEAAQLAAAAKRPPAAAFSVLGHVAFRRAQYDLAVSWHRKAVAADSRSSAFLCDLGTAQLAAGALVEALASFERALKLDPRSEAAIFGRADALERTGRRDRALDVLEPIVRAGRATPAMAVVYARAAVGAGRAQDAATFAEAQLGRPDLTPASRRSLLMLVGKALDKLGDVDGAFDAYRRGNSVEPPAFDVAVQRRRFDAIIDAFQPASLRALARATDSSRLPVFVFGMARSGTTLIEQVIHAHPQGHGAGEIHDLAHLCRMIPRFIGTRSPFPACVRELTVDHANRLAQSFVERLRTYDRRAERIVDKSLENYELAGLISVILPGATLIHARRHPLDACLSCYMQDFSPQLHPYATDLRNLGLFYREYDRLTSHWRSVLDGAMLEVRYEALVADPEPGIRRIVEATGLPWNDGCLRFHAETRAVATASYDQVNRPIYKTAVARFERYEKHLRPLREALGDVVAAYEAEA